MKLNDLPVCAKIADWKHPLVFLVADQSRSFYPGTVLFADTLAEAGCYDAPEPAQTFDDIRQFGFNRYPLSNLHQWLNASGRDWYTPAHHKDAPPEAGVIEPYGEKAGFLTEFSREFLDAARTVSVPYHYKDDYYQFVTKTVEAMAFLPSRTELGMDGGDAPVEGHPLEIARHRAFLSAAPTAALVEMHSLSPREFDPVIAYPYWLRSIDLRSFSGVYVAGGFGPPAVSMASRGFCGIRPLMVLDPETELSEPDRFGVRHILRKGASL